ncbi:MAG: hypothetical protein EPO23_03210 [Xanthobacteraceae bacterium]|nr:MAG: hypothetical protein EPO23_03210 [Xanthobacteraceae bacterium]
MKLFARLLAAALALALASSSFAQTNPGTSPLSIGKGGTGASTAASAFSNLKQSATTAASGVVQKGVDVRELLTAARTYYVRADGNDANDGLTNSSGGAFLTLQAAYTAVRSKLDFGGYTVTIQAGIGTYAGLSLNSAWLGGGSLVVKGENTTGAIIAGTGNGISITAPLPGTVTVQNFKFDGSGTSGKTAIQVTAPTKVIVSTNVEFGAYPSGYHINLSASGASFLAASGFAVSGGASAHIYATAWAFPQVEGSTVTLTGTPAFSWAFVVCESAKVRYTATISGGATGARYSAAANGVIQTASGSATYFPGDAAGSTVTGGQYF